MSVAEGLSPPLAQAWPRPSRPKPIVILGSGGIVENAHLPAYERLGLPVLGLYDKDRERAATLARKHSIARTFGSLADACAAGDVVFDVAVPAPAILEILPALPRGAPVLIQKPMGSNLGEARAILNQCREQGLEAAINFQLRFSPNMLALRDVLARGLLGTVSDVEVRVNTHTPWQLWPFLKGIERHEILYHSIHYLDLLRGLLGEPAGALAKVVGHPALDGYADTSSSIILDYGGKVRVSLAMNHSHRFGLRHAASSLRIEGTGGAVATSMGVNLDYPVGRPDDFEIAFGEGNAWQSVALRGSWFTEAFEGPMSNLQRYVTGEDDLLVTRVEDAFRTMAVVEACYESSRRGSVPIEQA